MSEVLSWPEVKAEFTEQLDAFRKAEFDSDQFIKKFEQYLVDHNDLDDETQDKLKKLITSSLLPEILTKALVNLTDDQSTRVIQNSAPVSQQASKEKEQSTDSHVNSSSLLERLMKWDVTKPPKKIEPGQIIRDTYCLDTNIGRGGMGEVWKAIDLIQDAGDSKDKFVAIKFIKHEIRKHPFALKALVREFSRYKKLIHPNIVKAYELNRDDNEVFIVMEYLDGEVLKNIIKQNSAGLSLKQAQPIIKGMCDALQYAHNEGIVHLDFKPGNVFFNARNQQCKVIDFGIARLSDSEDRDETRFDPGIMGAITTAYASKEMLMQADPDPKDDIYGLACVVYQLLSGKHPFDKKSSLKAEHENLKPHPIHGLNKAEFQAIAKGLNFNQKDRTANANQFYSELFENQNTVAANKPNNKLIKGAILAVLLVVLPYGLYKAYSNWQFNHVETAILEQNDQALGDFRSFSVSDQSLLLNSTKQRLALVDLLNLKGDADKNIIEKIAQFDDSIQQRLFSDQGVRQYLITDYIKQIDMSVKQDEYQRAKQLSADILRQYSDSRILEKKSHGIDSQKVARLNSLQRQYQQCLNNESQKLSEQFPCLMETRNTVRKIEPNHALLSSDDLSHRYSNETKRAINEKQLILAEKLLSNWHRLEPAENDQRVELTKTLANANLVESLILKISQSADQQISELLVLLSAQDGAIKQEVLNNQLVFKRLLGVYQQTTKQYLDNKKFNKVAQNISEMEVLFVENSTAQDSIKNAKEQLKQTKSDYLKSLKRDYAKQLKKTELDIAAFKEIQTSVTSFDSENPLARLPGLFKTIEKKINKAIANDQFDSAQAQINSLQGLKLSNHELKQIEGLTEKKAEFLAAFQSRQKANIKLKQAIETKTPETIINLLTEIKNQFPATADQNKIIKPNHEQMFEVFQMHINSFVQKDKFDNARQVLDQMLLVFPKNKLALANKKTLDKAKKTRISALLQQARQAVNTDISLVFSTLKMINAIDNDYLNKNTEIFTRAKQRFIDITDQNSKFSEMQNIVDQWSGFIASTKNLSQGNKEFYRKTTNLIALRCLFNGRKLKRNEQISQANEFFMFGLSLEPVLTVRNALEKELI